MTQKKQVAGEVSMAPGSVGGGCTGIHKCGRYPVSIDLSAEEGKKELTFDPSRLGDRPPTGELSSFVLLTTTAAVTVTSTQLWSTGRRSPPSSIIVLCAVLHQADGGRLSAVPCVWFYNEARPNERSDRGHLLPFGKKASS